MSLRTAILAFVSVVCIGLLMLFTTPVRSQVVQYNPEFLRGCFPLAKQLETARLAGAEVLADLEPGVMKDAITAYIVEGHGIDGNLYSDRMIIFFTPGRASSVLVYTFDGGCRTTFFFLTPYDKIMEMLKSNPAL